MILLWTGCHCINQSFQDIVRNSCIITVPWNNEYLFDNLEFCIIHPFLEYFFEISLGQPKEPILSLIEWHDRASNGQECTVIFENVHAAESVFVSTVLRFARGFSLKTSSCRCASDIILIRKNDLGLLFELQFLLDDPLNMLYLLLINNPLIEGSRG